MGILQLYRTIYQQVVAVKIEEHAVAARVLSSGRVAECTDEVLRIEEMLARHMSPPEDEDDADGADAHGAPAGPSAGPPPAPPAPPAAAA